MVEAMDDGIGMIIKKLKELNLEDNTLVFFLQIMEQRNLVIMED